MAVVTMMLVKMTTDVSVLVMVLTDVICTALWHSGSMFLKK